MKDVVLIEAASKSTYQRKYKCPYCEQKFERNKLHIHIQNKHEEQIPEGYTALRVAFNTINNKTEGHCIMCGKVSDWNENKGRYERLCNDPKCHEAYKKMAAERNKNKYGVERLQSDPRYAEEVQRKAMQGRRIAGKYKFTDGGEIEYLGAYERRLLEFMDKVMNCKSEDILAPGPSMNYMYQGKEHLYIPDFYYIPYNLIIEIKDGGDNPNTNPAMRGYKTERQEAKEAAVKASGKYNYIRQTNNDFSQLMSIMAVLKYNLQNEVYDPVMRINEFTLLESQDKSTLNKNFKKKTGIEFYLVDTQSKKFKDSFPEKMPKRKYENYGIGALVKGTDEYAGFVEVAPKWVLEEKWHGNLLYSLYVSKKFRGYGLSNLLVKEAVNKYDANMLWVDTDNEVAINLYKNFGFKIVDQMKDKDNNDAYIMTRPTAKKEDNTKSINESILFNEKDIYYNKNKFDFGEINLCFITGHSGSGKSTMARNMQKDNIEHYELDDLQCIKDHFTMAQLKEYGDLIYSYFNGPGKKFYITYKELIDNKIPGSEYEDKLFPGFVHYAMQYARSHKNRKYVIEGVWLFDRDESGTPYFNPEEFKDYAFYIKGTSLIISKYRAAKRDAKLENNKQIDILRYTAKGFFKNWKWYFIDEKQINRFRNYFNKISVNEFALLLEEDMSKYERPYTYQEIVENYGKETADRLMKDPAHRWRAQTEIELIHKEPNLKELNRIWKNWNYMTDDMKNKSDKKSYELFNLDNKDNYNKLKKEYINESANMNEDMSGTIGAALPLTPSPTPYESDPDHYLIVNTRPDQKLSYSITKDPLQYTLYSVDPQEKGFYKVFKSDKGKISKNYLTFKIKDKQKAKELYENLIQLYNRNLTFMDHGLTSDVNENYIYSYLTNGNNIISPDQILFDTRFELVRSFEESINYESTNLYNYLLYGSSTENKLNTLSEQVKELEEIIYE